MDVDGSRKLVAQVKCSMQDKGQAASDCNTFPCVFIGDATPSRPNASLTCILYTAACWQQACRSQAEC